LNLEQQVIFNGQEGKDFKEQEAEKWNNFPRVRPVAFEQFGSGHLAMLNDERRILWLRKLAQE
jgi:hypothetical protein